MQLSPHAFPFLHTLQHAAFITLMFCCFSRVTTRQKSAVVVVWISGLSAGGPSAAKDAKGRRAISAMTPKSLISLTVQSPMINPSRTVERPDKTAPTLEPAEAITVDQNQQEGRTTPLPFIRSVAFGRIVAGAKTIHSPRARPSSTMAVCHLEFLECLSSHISRVEGCTRIGAATYTCEAFHEEVAVKKAFLLTLLVSYAGVSFADDPEGQIVGNAMIVDGDTLNYSVRLFGVDTPETQQVCEDRSGECYRCGEEAAEFLHEMLSIRRSGRSGEPVTCEFTGETTYGRPVASCSVEGQDIGEALIRNGWAYAYTRFLAGTPLDAPYRAAQAAAEASGIGMWQGDHQEPSEYRKNARFIQCDWR